eukprot:Partr_v1_DN28638_c0_g1_i2_m49763 putative Plasma membrane osmosensor that activates the high osmolarity glycerol (HOG) MAPK signaling pathway in response to high osmolarity (By similarity)
MFIRNILSSPFWLASITLQIVGIIIQLGSLSSITAALNAAAQTAVPALSITWFCLFLQFLTLPAIIMTILQADSTAEKSSLMGYRSLFIAFIVLILSQLMDSTNSIRLIQLGVANLIDSNDDEGAYLAGAIISSIVWFVWLVVFGSDGNTMVANMVYANDFPKQSSHIENDAEVGQSRGTIPEPAKEKLVEKPKSPEIKQSPKQQFSPVQNNQMRNLEPQPQPLPMPDSTPVLKQVEPNIEVIPTPRARSQRNTQREIAVLEQVIADFPRDNDGQYDSRKSMANTYSMISDAAMPTGEIAVAMYNYSANPEDPTEVSFQKGDKFEILDKSGKWWQIRTKEGLNGIAPSNYLQVDTLS